MLDFLLGAPGLSPLLAGAVRRVVPSRRPDQVVLPAELLAEARKALAPEEGAAVARPVPVLLHLSGPDGVGKTLLAEVCCGELGCELLVARLPELAALGEGQVGGVLRLLFTEARLLDALVFLEGPSR